MKTSFLKLATDDDNLIDHLKEIIDYQCKVITKRETLVYGITHNVKYLSELNMTTSA